MEISGNPWWRREKQEKKIAFLHFRKENVHVESRKSFGFNNEPAP